MTALYYATISELAGKIKNKEISPVELTKLTFDRIEQVDDKLCSYITVMRGEALAAAEEAERQVMSGQYRGHLHGIPIALKDLLYTKDVRTTAGSKLLEHYIPTYDATVVTKLNNAGAIITGKLNMHEFAFGATNRNEHYGHTRNPWDVTRMTGGSSGGSGAAVAAGLCFASLGSDTGGSIRTPAALSGIYGLKPTYGRVSKYGAIPLAWSLDHIGPMTRSVADLALVLQVIAGYDPNDPTTVQQAVPEYRQGLEEGVKGLRVGVPTHYFFENVEEEVEQSVRAAIQQLEKLGADLVEITIPELDLAVYSELITIRSEAAAYHHETLQKNDDLYGSDVAISLKAGELVTAVDYVRAQQARRKLQASILNVFQKVDVIAAPTLTMTAPEVQASFKFINGENRAVSAEFVRLAAPANLTGIPSLSMPTGFSSEGLPIGMQLMGKSFSEHTLLKTAAALEREIDRERRTPIP